MKKDGSWKQGSDEGWRIKERREAGRRNAESQQGRHKGQRKVENSESRPALDQRGAGALGLTSAPAGGACTSYKMTQIH